jgi:hypothetical protein
MGDLGIPHHPLNRKVLDIAVTAKQLHRVRGDLHRNIGGKALCSPPKNGKSPSPRSDLAAAA